jgi:hypothetical protein
MVSPGEGTREGENLEKHSRATASKLFASPRATFAALLLGARVDAVRKQRSGVIALLAGVGEGSAGLRAEGKERLIASFWRREMLLDFRG